MLYSTACGDVLYIFVAGVFAIASPTSIQLAEVQTIGALVAAHNTHIFMVVIMGYSLPGCHGPM